MSQSKSQVNAQRTDRNWLFILINKRGFDCIISFLSSYCSIFCCRGDLYSKFLAALKESKEIYVLIRKIRLFKSCILYPCHLIVHQGELIKIYYLLPSLT
ncbi:hypothetical protein lpl1166 [Legionella pneumophila str. Lens]|uniref:Uncharacterized protein n=1 Tax=Legionella pneumophila (strain Lens) TaxID=297245 RepID=Q5WXD2_LEGPL|nr:hypothetical protein lpl1166 [Legionella pneumophila str. Lens]